MRPINGRQIGNVGRKRPFTHPEYGELTPDWVAAQLAGHDIHHLKQLHVIDKAQL
jgi:hypothetical protein